MPPTTTPENSLTRSEEVAGEHSILQLKKEDVFPLGWWKTELGE